MAPCSCWQQQRPTSRKWEEPVGEEREGRALELRASAFPWWSIKKELPAAPGRVTGAGDSETDCSRVVENLVVVSSLQAESQESVSTNTLFQMMSFCKEEPFTPAQPFLIRQGFWTPRFHWNLPPQIANFPCGGNHRFRLRLRSHCRRSRWHAGLPSPAGPDTESCPSPLERCQSWWDPLCEEEKPSFVIVCGFHSPAQTVPRALLFRNVP